MTSDLSALMAQAAAATADAQGQSEAPPGDPEAFVALLGGCTCAPEVAPTPLPPGGEQAAVDGVSEIHRAHAQSAGSAPTAPAMATRATEQGIAVAPEISADAAASGPPGSVTPAPEGERAWQIGSAPRPRPAAQQRPAASPQRRAPSLIVPDGAGAPAGEGALHTGRARAAAPTADTAGGRSQQHLPAAPSAEFSPRQIAAMPEIGHEQMGAQATERTDAYPPASSREGLPSPLIAQADSRSPGPPGMPTPPPARQAPNPIVATPRADAADLDPNVRVVTHEAPAVVRDASVEAHPRTERPMVRPDRVALDRPLTVTPSAMASAQEQARTTASGRGVRWQTPAETAGAEAVPARPGVEPARPARSARLNPGGAVASRQPTVVTEATTGGEPAPSPAPSSAGAGINRNAVLTGERAALTVEAQPERWSIAREPGNETRRVEPTDRTPTNRLSPTGVEISDVQARAHDLTAPRPANRAGPTVAIREVARISPANLRPEQPQRLTVEVNPPELGRCELELSLHDGRVRATLIAERPETALTLRAVEGQVREQLAARDLQITQFDVRHSGQAGHDGTAMGGRQHPGARPEQPGQAAPRMARPPETTFDGMRRAPMTSTTIDLMA